MLNIHDVEVGDEIKCIDIDGFCRADSTNIKILEKFPRLVVVKKNQHNIFLTDRESEYTSAIYKSELKFFSLVTSFTKLKNIIESAFECGRIDSYHLKWEEGKEVLSWSKKDNAFVVSCDDDDLIWQWCDILTDKEKFVISCSEDVLRIKKGAILELDENTTAVVINEAIGSGNYNSVEVTFHQNDTETFILPHVILIGATVNQNNY